MPTSAQPASRLQTFHYGIPPELENSLKLGHLIWAPFGPREVQGIVVGIEDERSGCDKAHRPVGKTGPR